MLYKSLTKHGFNAGELHGDMDQSSRTETLDKFRNGEIMLLAASDVAARGLDIPDVSHIFNFDLPWAADDYVHRIGRTGRAGKEGYSASLVSPDDLKFVKDIEKITGEAAIWFGNPPTEEDIAGAGKRRRGRGGRSAPEKSSRPPHRGERSDNRPPRPAQVQSAKPQEPRRKSPEAAPAAEPAAAVRQEQSQHRQNGSESNRSRPTTDAWADAPRGPVRGAPESRGSKKEAPRNAPPPQKIREGVGFAENVPAFMRKASRPDQGAGARLVRSRRRAARVAD